LIVLEKQHKEFIDNMITRVGNVVESEVQDKETMMLSASALYSMAIQSFKLVVSNEMLIKMLTKTIESLAEKPSEGSRWDTLH